MSLTHETIMGRVGGYAAGDMKLIGYSVAFTAQQLVEPETGWFLLNGAAISRTTYPTLFARFGTTFGSGDGSTTFNLPDFTDGKTPLPKGLTNFTSYAASGGEITHTLSTGEMNNHSHADTFLVSVGAHSHSGSGSCGGPNQSHTHQTSYLLHGSVGGSSSGTLYDVNVGITSGSTNTDGGHTHGLSASVGSTTSPNLSVSGSINATGSGGSHNNLQPYLVMGGWLVKYG